MRYRCWDEECQEESDGLEIEEADARRAAEVFCEKRFAQDSYPQQRTVHVLALDVKVFDVQTRSTPEFEATETRPKVGPG